MAVDTQQVYAKIRENAAWYWGGGILFIVMGAVAILVPLVATLALTLLVGILFIIGGGYELARAFRHRGEGRRVFGAVLFGVLALIAGIVLVANPLEGAVTLTLFLGIFFLVSGAFRGLGAFDLRPARGWGWMLFGGLISVVIGVLILAGLPQSGIWVLGLLVGIDFLFFGATLIAIAIAAGKLPSQ